MLRDDGAAAVADVQLCHGSAHSLLHHFLASQNCGQLFSDGLRERKMRFLAEQGAVQMVRQTEHVPPGLVTLRMVTIEKACWGSGIQHQSEFPAEIVCILHTSVHTLATNIGADMGGVPNEKDAADLISLRLTAVDTVANAPDGITQHATWAPGIGYRLEVLQGWLSRRRMISLGQADIGNESGTSSGQREKAEHAIGSEERGQFVPRQLPVNPDIGRDEIGGIIVTREQDDECVANGTMGAVAGDEIGDVGGLLPALGTPKRCAHAVFVLLERNELDSSFHFCAERRQMSGQHALCLALRQLQNEGKGRVQLVKGQVVDEFVLGSIGRFGVAGLTNPNKLVRKANGVQNFQRARLNGSGAGLMGRPVVLVDNPAGNAISLQLNRHEQARWTCAHHQYLGVSGHPVSSRSCPLCRSDAIERSSTSCLRYSHPNE